MFYPAGRYNLNFDVCAIFLCGFMLLYFILKKNLHIRRVRAIFWVALFMLLSASGELIMDIARNNNGIYFSNGQAEIATLVSHLAHNSVPFLLSIYLLTLTGLVHIMTNKHWAAFCLPETALIVSHFITPVRRLFYYYHGDCVYVRGPLYNGYYIFVTFYIICGAIILFAHLSSVRKKDCAYILFLCGGFLFAMIVGIINPYIKITNFLQVLFLVSSFLLLENDYLIDERSGLYNTRGLMRDTYSLFSASYKSYVLSVKMQHFNYYRLMLGTTATTNVMRQIGRWMRANSSEECMFYRVGNGEFAVILINQDEADAMALAKRIQSRFAQPWLYATGNTSIAIPAQVWISSIPDRISTEEQILTFAQATFNDRLPQDEIFVANEMQEEQRRIDVNVAIRRAITENSFEVYYQPIYDTKTSKIHSCEALVRMNDPKLGFVSPEEFIKIAEQTGTISQIGEIVFEKVCQFIATENPKQFGLDFIEVNLSTIQCMDKNLVERFLAIMDCYDVTPDDIVFEITESAVIHNEGRMNHIVEALCNAGFLFALDDFGTGHANYVYLSQYPFHVIKIDKHFLWAAEKSEVDRTILHNMLNLAHDLKLETVVEGVETKEQRDRLILANVDYLQGYYYSKPVPKDDFVKYTMTFNEAADKEANEKKNRKKAE